jgi:hypothetical protein
MSHRPNPRFASRSGRRRMADTSAPERDTLCSITGQSASQLTIRHEYRSGALEPERLTAVCSGSYA